MQTTIALAALAAVAYAAPQGVTEDIAPSAPAPPGCSENYNGEFQIAAVKVAAAKRDLEKRQSTCGSEGSLTLTLKDGVLLDGQKRTGYIADNFQFQFDGPAQTGAIYTDGFSACSNTSLALGGSTVFYQCLSGSFYNLYDRSWAEQCEPVALQILGCSGSSPSNGVGQIGDGQVTGTAVGSPVTQIGDGQIQGPTNVPVVTELPDGQPQAPTIMPAPITQIGDGQIQAPSGTPVTQIGDGQIQAPTGAPVVSQISDGQVQAPTGVVSQIPDGQVQAPTGVVSQIPDGQVQAPTGTVAPITQIGDGQIQAPTGSVAPITQIGDGQIQAPTGTPNATSAVEFTGAGNSLVAASGLAGLMAVVALLL